MQRRSHETQKIGYGISASPPRPSGSPGSGTTSNRNAHYVLVDHGTEYYLGIGTVRSLKRQGPVGEPESESEGHELQFRIAPWFKAWGISLIIKRQFGYIQFTLRPLRLVTGDSPIMKACAMGDTEEVRRLVTTKEASPSDATYDDVTPVHIAASWLRPETCRLLLELGADAASIVRYQGITWYVECLWLKSETDIQGRHLGSPLNEPGIIGSFSSLTWRSCGLTLMMGFLRCVKQCAFYWNMATVISTMGIFLASLESGTKLGPLCMDFEALTQTIFG